MAKCFEVITISTCNCVNIVALPIFWCDLTPTFKTIFRFGWLHLTLQTYLSAFLYFVRSIYVSRWGFADVSISTEGYSGKSKKVKMKSDFKYELTYDLYDICI